MARIFILVLMLFVAVALAASFVDASEKRQPTRWQTIIGFKISGAKAYIDQNSFKVYTVENGNQYTSVEVLMSYDKPTKMDVNGTPKYVRGAVRSMIVDCESGLVAPLFDMYFTEALPTRSSVPLGGIEYPTDVSKTASRLSKSSLMFGALCPKYI